MEAAVESSLPSGNEAVGQQKSTWRRAASLAAPLTAYFLVQNVLSLAVLAMIGRLGTTSVAGLGIAQTVFGVLLALLYGFDTGVQAVVARAWGAEMRETAGRALGEALVAAIPFGILLTLFLYADGAKLIGALTHEPHARAVALAYIYAEAPSLALFAASFPFNAYWIASGAPRISFFITAVLAPLQIALSALFIFGGGPVPALGIAGAGYAVLAAAVAGLVVQIAVASWRRVPGFGQGPRLSGIGTILKLGWPVSAQQSLGNVALVVAYAIIAVLGTPQIAILNVLATLMLLPSNLTTAFGMAASTLAGQALGRDDVADARHQGWRVGAAGALIMLPLALLVLIAPKFVLVQFLTDPATRALAVLPAQFLALSMSVGTFAGILGYALRGTGATRVATAIPFFLHFVIELPLIWYVGIGLGGGFNAMVAAQVALTFVEAASYFVVWRRGNWAHVRIAGISRHDENVEIARLVPTLRRVAVFGGAGAGKSTFARALGAKLGLPVIHLDRLVYGPQWTMRSFDVMRADLADALKDGCWVTDGIYGGLNELILPAVELVIWLEQPFPIRLWRTWRKTRIGRTQPRADRPDECAEQFGLQYLITIASFGRFTPKVEKRLIRKTSATILCLRGDREVAAFLDGAPLSNLGCSSAARSA